MEAEQVIQLIQHEMNKVQGVSKKMLFNEIGTPGGPKTIDRVGDQSKMLSNTLYWSDVPIYPF